MKPSKLAGRVTRAVRAQLGYAAGLVVAAVGFGLELGAGWGLAIGGTAAAASFLLLTETDEGRR